MRARPACLDRSAARAYIEQAELAACGRLPRCDMLLARPIRVLGIRGNPVRQLPLTWSCISAIGGLATIASLSDVTAGSCQQRLLPAPVGMAASTSRPSPSARDLLVARPQPRETKTAPQRRRKRVGQRSGLAHAVPRIMRMMPEKSVPLPLLSTKRR
jgi:hypothetical protein